MAQKHKRYQLMERGVSTALIIDLLFFILYLILSGTGVQWGKITFSILVIILSGGILGFLYLNKELLKLRSMWMSLAAAAMLICTLFSLLLNFPRPKPVYTPLNYSETNELDTNPADDDYNKDGYVQPEMP